MGCQSLLDEQPIDFLIGSLVKETFERFVTFRNNLYL